MQPPALIDPDQRVVLRGVGRKELEMMLAIRGDQAGVRVTYLKGELELTSPSRSHESIKDEPDLAIEVIWTSGGIEKLEVYRGLGVGEVWIWRDHVIEVHLLRDGAYHRADRSQLLPDFHLDRAARCIRTAPSQTAAVRDFLAAVP